MFKKFTQFTVFEAKNAILVGEKYIFIDLNDDIKNTKMDENDPKEVDPCVE